jgi:hypothetical protein
MAGSPIQQTPEYVLNPLAIYRMARRNVQERHAPENTRSTPVLYTESSMNNPGLVPPPARFQDGRGNLNSNANRSHQSLDTADASSTGTLFAAHLPGAHPAAGAYFAGDIPQFNFDGSGGTSWQPADTLLDGMEWGGGMPPWSMMGMYRLPTQQQQPTHDGNMEFLQTESEAAEFALTGLTQSIVHQ